MAVALANSGTGGALPLGIAHFHPDAGTASHDRHFHEHLERHHHDRDENLVRVDDPHEHAASGERALTVVLDVLPLSGGAVAPSTTVVAVCVLPARPTGAHLPEGPAKPPDAGSVLLLA